MMNKIEKHRFLWKAFLEILHYSPIETFLEIFQTNGGHFHAWLRCTKGSKAEAFAEFLAPFWVCRGNRDGRVRVGVICNLVLRCFLLSAERVAYVCRGGVGGLSFLNLQLCHPCFSIACWGERSWELRSESKKAFFCWIPNPWRESIMTKIITSLSSALGGFWASETIWL